MGRRGKEKHIKRILMINTIYNFSLKINFINTAVVQLYYILNSVQLHGPLTST